METPKKTSYIFSKESRSYVSGNGNHEKKSLLIKKRNFLIFWEKYIHNLYLELDVYSEPRYNHNLRHIQNIYDEKFC